MRRIPPLPRLPNALLGLLTLDCFGGPLALWLVVRGGASGEWPPDRAIEWLVAGVVVTSAAALFLACITIGWWYPWPGRRRTQAGPGRIVSGLGRRPDRAA